MIRCFLISVFAHLAVIIGLIVLSLIPGPAHKPRIIRISLTSGPIGPSIGPPGPPSATVANTPPAPEPPKPATTPAATPAPPKPQTTPLPNKPVIRQTPKPAETPRVVKTPAPASTPKPAATPAIKQLKREVAVAQKTIVQKPKKGQLVDKLMTPTPPPTPQPTPQEVQVAEVIQQDVTPPDEGVKENTPPEVDTALPEVPDKPAKTPPTVDPGLLAPAATPAISGQQFKSKGGALSGGSIGGVGGGGGGGGLGGMEQTYFAVAFAKIEENFQPPLTRPGIICSVQFNIMRDGTITDIKLIKKTGLGPSWDGFATSALEKTQKLPSLYDSFKENYLTIILNFNYETRR